MGALISGIIFMGSAVLKLMGADLTDPLALNTMWNIFLIWFLVSMLLLILPLIITYVRNRSSFREFLLYQFGGISFFTPFWFILATEVSGEAWMEVLVNGVDNGLPFFNTTGELVGIHIGPIILIPSLVLMILIGLFFLRPGFIEEQIAPEELPEFVALKEKPSPPPIEPIEDEMPDVKPPVPDASSIEELRALLVELAIPAETVNAIIAGGFKTITDLVATSPEQFASSTGLEARVAQEIHLAIQKRVWFGGI